MAYNMQTQPQKPILFAPPDPDEIDPKLKQIVHLLDEAVTIPGTNFRVGLDGLLGLIPGIGDLATGLFGVWMLQEASRLGVPWYKRFLIGTYYGIDTLIGAIPLFGDLFDFGFKCHKMSLNILEKHVAKRRSEKVRVVAVDGKPV
jgi:hypothetical protein